jgi:hypothetical protein
MKTSAAMGMGMMSEVLESMGPDGDGRDLYGDTADTDGVRRNSLVARRVARDLATRSGKIIVGGSPRVDSAASAALARIRAGIPANKGDTATELASGVLIRSAHRANHQQTAVVN